MKSDKLRTIILVGYLAGSDKCGYLERLDECLNDLGYCLLLIEQGGRELETTCAVHRLPEGMAEGEYPISETMRCDWEMNRFLQHAVDVDKSHFGIDADEAARRCLPTAEYIREVLRREDTALCILWHQFNGLCMVLEEFCRQESVPCLYAHLGLLPGTIAFDSDGQMAESWLCQGNQKFLDLPVNQDDRVRAAAYIDHLRQTRADRKPQATDWSITDRVQMRRDKNELPVFCAGQNDFRTGMAPRSLPNAHLHSPFFESSIDALGELAALAEDHHWSILYKPHPNIQVRETYSNTACIDTVTGANIFECILESEVTVTILSTASYLALIHEKPVVLLGTSPLNGKGCAYEVGSREDVASVIDSAIRDGFTDSQRECWLQHVAQLIKHYLFAYDETAVSYIGRDADVAASYIVQHCRRE